jgi:hypothetical protein
MGQGNSAIIDARGEIIARVEPGTLRADATVDRANHDRTPEGG